MERACTQAVAIKNAVAFRDWDPDDVPFFYSSTDLLLVIYEPSLLILSLRKLIASYKVFIALGIFQSLFVAIMKGIQIKEYVKVSRGIPHLSHDRFTEPRHCADTIQAFGGIQKGTNVFPLRRARLTSKSRICPTPSPRPAST